MNIACAFNTRKPPLDNLNVRRAISLAINNQRLMQSIYYGTAETLPRSCRAPPGPHDNDASPGTIRPNRARCCGRPASAS